MKKTLSKHPFLYSGIAIVVLIVIALFVFRNSGTNYETMTVERKDFKIEVAASGRVVAHDRADLGFEQNGKISSIYVKVSDTVKKGLTIASIDNADLRADLAQKQAILAREQAKLSSIVQGTRTEQLNIDSQNFIDSSRSLLVAMRAAYVASEGAMLNYVDTLFTNGNSVNPTIILRTQSYNEQKDIEEKRLRITEKLSQWKNTLSLITDTTDETKINNARDIAVSTFDSMKTFVDKLSYIANNNFPGNSGLTQSQIDVYRNAVNVADANITSANETFQTADTSWSKYRATLSLSKAGSTKQDIIAQSAQVDSALADVAVSRSKLSKSIIIAPFDGIITRVDGKIGEIVSPNTSLFSIMSTSTYEIESYVPEVHIANITPGNKVSVTLDAYGTDIIFNAEVISIDPAETIKDGVSTYKVTMKFTDHDPRIKSGMTASVKIITKEKADTIVIPQGFIKTNNTGKYVTILKDNKKIQIPVVTDGLSALGQSDIIEGLSGGEVIIIEKAK